jgi:hypothetical protein
MTTQWFTDIAKEFYDNNFSPKIDVGDDSLAARVINTRKKYSIQMINSLLSEEEKKLFVSCTCENHN